MSKYLLGGVLGLIIGVCTGVVTTILVYPFIFPPPVVNEQIADVDAKTVIASGHFIHPNPSDPVHWGKGGVSIYRQENSKEVFLESDFEVGPGPAYHVYLSSGKDIRNNDDFNSAVNTDIGTLKSFKGSQIYKVSSGSLDPAQYNSVVIWCVAFNQLITSANLIKQQ
jgi:hypothetical protein